MTEDTAERQMQFLFQLRQRGVMDKATLNAMEKVDRGAFVKGLFAERAYEDMPLPIACGQTISQPSVVGLMTQALNIQPRDKVLEVGTGSGYQAAILSRLCSQVYTVERINVLLAGSRRVFDQLRYFNIIAKLDDGTLGWPEHGPFDAIIVTAGGPEIPEPLVDQLGDDS